MDDDSDRSSEATELENLTTQRKRHSDTDDAEDSGTVNEDESDDDETDDQREVSELDTSPMEIDAYSRTCQSETLVSGLAEVPIQYEMRQDELEHLKNHLQGSHQEALAIVIAKAAQSQSGSKIQIPKQVKSPEGSRSYYKCTYNECEAKKIESCDQYNSITKIVYKGQHKHEQPKKVFTRRGKVLSSSKGQERKFTSKQCKSSGSISNGAILVEEMDAPPPKRRVKKNSMASPGSVLKAAKKPKFVVHAAGDVGISADGYRWRKYGQKMVKGNPHPRNYYKCTSAGCPVRKHIEMAVDGSSEVILTYKGVHDHDIPIHTKHINSPNPNPNALLLTAVSSPNPDILT
ncbi:unnamed protein product [Lactuca saligna]|uniref:WRKY domain-containing protein n=1 Tax=Lactuca saligna TaxID=75948 RepID=A0AA36EHD5_LACSI|nr:unnamed protein product [Lactuca saligna]